MTPEEFEKIKEAEKDHLRKVRKLKSAVKQLERQKKISGALNDLTTSVQEKFDDHDEMMSRVAIDAALNEARLEIAMESSQEADQGAELEQDEADLAKAKAREVMQQFRDMPGSDPGVDQTESTESTTEKSSTHRVRPGKPDSRDDLPEKTIGRMKP